MGGSWISDKTDEEDSIEKTGLSTPSITHTESIDKEIAVAFSACLYSLCLRTSSFVFAVFPQASFIRVSGSVRVGERASLDEREGLMEDSKNVRRARREACVVGGK